MQQVAYKAFKAAGGERIIHRTPERLAATVERYRQRIEALRAEPRGGTGENLYGPESDASRTRKARLTNTTTRCSSPESS